jgi:PKD repeat protein
MNIQKISIGLLILGLIVGMSFMPASADWKDEVIDKLEGPSPGDLFAISYKTPWIIYPNDSHAMNICFETDTGVDEDHKHIYIDLNPDSKCDGDHGSDCDFSYKPMVIDLDKDRRLWTFYCRGLQPDEDYSFKICYRDHLTDWWSSKTGHFHTAPHVVTSKLRFYAFGDTRGEAKTDDVASSIKEDHHRRGGKFVIHTGDIVFRGGRVCHWDGLNIVDPWSDGFWGYQGAIDMLRSMPIFTTIGNHDFDTDDFDKHSDGINDHYYYRYFKYPMYPAVSDLDDFYYSFGWGPAKFFSLTNYPMDHLCSGSHPVKPGTDQYNWLVEQLENLEGKGLWKIVFMHGPAYACNCRVPEVRDYLVPLFEQYGVDLVLSGHAHYYSRKTVNGITYLVLGGGGAELEDLDYKKCVEDKRADFAAKKYHYAYFDIDHDYMQIEARTDNGTIFDKIVLDRTPKADFDVKNGGSLEVKFTDKTAGYVNSWEWDFNNDGIVDSTLQNPTHNYTASKSYDVTLMATSSFNSCSKYTRNINVPVGDDDHQPPTCNDAWTHPFAPFKTPGWFGGQNQGGGVSTGDINGNYKPELIAFHIDHPSSGGNNGYYRIGWDVNSAGIAYSWSPPHEIPGWFGGQNQGGGISTGDINGNRIPDLIVFHIDHPSGGNNGYYRIGWDVDSAGIAYSWSPPHEIPGWFGDENQGGGISTGDINCDGILDLIAFHIDNPSGENHGYYRIGWDVQSNGRICSICSSP